MSQQQYEPSTRAVFTCHAQSLCDKSGLRHFRLHSIVAHPAIESTTRQDASPEMVGWDCWRAANGVSDGAGSVATLHGLPAAIDDAEPQHPAGRNEVAAVSATAELLSAALGALPPLWPMLLHAVAADGEWFETRASAMSVEDFHRDRVTWTRGRERAFMTDKYHEKLAWLRRALHSPLRRHRRTAAMRLFSYFEVREDVLLTFLDTTDFTHLSAAMVDESEANTTTRITAALALYWTVRAAVGYPTYDRDPNAVVREGIGLIDPLTSRRNVIMELLDAFYNFCDAATTFSPFSWEDAALFDELLERLIAVLAAHAPGEAAESRDEVLLQTLMFTAVLFCERRRATIQVTAVRTFLKYTESEVGKVAEFAMGRVYDIVCDAARNFHNHLTHEALQELGGTLARYVEHPQPAVAVQAVRCLNVFDGIATFWLPLLVAALPCAVRRYMADQLGVDGAELPVLALMECVRERAVTLRPGLEIVEALALLQKAESPAVRACAASAVEALQRSVPSIPTKGPVFPTAPTNGNSFSTGFAFAAAPLPSGKSIVFPRREPPAPH
jgi:hypothetical protein